MSDFALSMDVDDVSMVPSAPSTGDDTKPRSEKNKELAEELEKQRERGTKQAATPKAAKIYEKACPVLDCVLACNKKRFCLSHFPAYEIICRKTFPKEKKPGNGKGKVKETDEDDYNTEQKAFVKIFGSKSGEQLLSQFVLNATLAPPPPHLPLYISPKQTDSIMCAACRCLQGHSSRRVQVFMVQRLY